MKYRPCWSICLDCRGCRVTPITSNVLLVKGLNFMCVFPFIFSYPDVQLHGMNRCGSLKSGTSNLKHLQNLPKIDTCSEPWKRVTFVVRNWIFIVLTLHARSYQSCKNQRLDLLTLVTLNCQIQVEYRWNTGPTGQFVLISGVPCYTYTFKCPVSLKLILHVFIPI